MQIQVLGCSGGIDPDNPTTTFLLDEDTLIDAGSGIYGLPFDVQKNIQHIFITHAHFDHLVGLPLLIDSVSRYRANKQLPPVQVYAPAATLESIRKYIFNGHIWPDFTCLPSPENPTLRFVAIEEGQPVELSNKRIVEALPARHNIRAVGYAVHQQQDTWAFTGDTAGTPELWAYLNQLPARGQRLRWLVAETAFANQNQALANITVHYTARTLAQDIRLHMQYGGFELHLTHLKPEDKNAIVQDLAELQSAAHALNCSVHILQKDFVFNTAAQAQTTVPAAAPSANAAAGARICAAGVTIPSRTAAESCFLQSR